jgi:hypothetical protein
MFYEKKASVLESLLKDVYRFYVSKEVPGIIIFVHGVNSEGEWFDQAEQGLCAGLNERMKRRDQYVAVPDKVGQLQPATYRSELTATGFVDDKLDGETFINEFGYSPVIRFRWGYKADQATVAGIGGNIWLNEFHAWGGGPFANGCTALADLWNQGLNDELFLWLTAQDLNPEANRDVYACPHRAYYAHAAWRLAKLIALIREKHPDCHGDCPVTVLCHSQGNMIGLASAFIGDKKFDGKGVADTYILANAPYSLVPSNFTENWAQRDLKSGEIGRVKAKARETTLKHFLNLVRQRQGFTQPEDKIDEYCGNKTPKDGSPGWCMAADKAADRINQGRVFVYCNPHDQVISAQTVQGIGWQGLNHREIEAVGGQGVLYQRVFAQGIKVGDGRDTYDYWKDRWNVKTKDPHTHKEKDNPSYWSPAPNHVRANLQRDDDNRPALKKLAVTLVKIVAKMALSAAKISILASPQKDWRIPINAPALDEPMEPSARRQWQGNTVDGPFDEHKDPEAWQMAVNPEVTDPKDPYRKTQAAEPGLARGDVQSESTLRYEHHARVRMQARRTEEYKEAADHLKPDELDQLPTKFREWSDKRRAKFLMDSCDVNATDHSTILTNATHAEKVIAYDVALGHVQLKKETWMMLRQFADWRWVPNKDEDIKLFGLDYSEYYLNATIDGKALEKHADYSHNINSDMPKSLGIDDQRTNKYLDLDWEN